MLPFRLAPVFKNYLWGGEKLIREWGKTSANFPLAESWELAAHDDGDNVILDGKLAGEKLSDAVKKFPDIVGPNFNPAETFPIMVKLIDAKNSLSIQVHPNSNYARRVENSRGKTEAWYILEHEKDAFIYLGFDYNVARSDFEEAIKNNSLPDLLRKVYVKKGDMFFIPPGTIHAIGAGITLAEIQENSNITYRVYDYGRKDADGKTRKLHIDKALDVANTFPLNISPPGKKGNVIVSCNKFHVERFSAPYTGQVHNDGFRFLLCLDGKSFFKCEDFSCEISKGENIFIPSNCESDFSLDGVGEFLITSL